MIDQYDSLIFAAASSTDDAIDETNKLAHLIEGDDSFEPLYFFSSFYGFSKK